MVGDIKAISPCVKSASAKLFLDLHTVSAPSGEERMLNAAAQVERAGRCCRRQDRARTRGVAVLLAWSWSPQPQLAARERMHSRSAIGRVICIAIADMRCFPWIKPKNVCSTTP